jgi:hypothetical protein
LPHGNSYNSIVGAGLKDGLKKNKLPLNQKVSEFNSMMASDLLIVMTTKLNDYNLPSIEAAGNA